MGRKLPDATPPLSHIVAFLLSALITAFCMYQMKSYPSVSAYWWLAFMVITMIFVGEGLSKGRIKGDPIIGLIIAFGPFTFFFWTIVRTWNKYGKRKIWKNQRENTA